VDPGTTYALDVATGRSSPARAASGEGRTDDVVTETMHVKASDGADIPVFLVRRRGVPRDGTAPAVLYGYGFSGWNASPYFYPAMAAFVRRGGLWAVPVLRGDGGYGTAWHLAGRARNKPRSIADYIDVAEALVQRHDTSKDRLVANGSSAGGPLVAAAAVKRPDLFRAVLLDYPLVDMLRYETAPLARRWVTEYGTVGDPEDLRILRSYSAYQNLVKGACYPAFFLAPGENDGIAPPWHAAKLAAALENVERGSGCSRPVLLRVSWGAGHAAGADLETSVENWTDQMAFLSSVLPAGALPSR
jgi:prolyl oligopeptidase